MAKKRKSSVKALKKTNISFWDKLVPRSSKAKLIVFLIAFTLIGGVYMTYRSSAASDNFTVTADAGTLIGRSGATVITESAEGSKKNRKVVKVPDVLNASATLASSESTMNDYRAFIYRNAGKQVRLCGFMRPKNTIRIQVYGPAATAWEFIDVTPGNGKDLYKYVCTKYARLANPVNGYSIPEVRVAHGGTTNYINIWGLVVEAL